ncbi:MAG: DNA polymerase III subunit alpha [Buchnera aphidicola (Meitanaphis elongallis)]
MLNPKFIHLRVHSDFSMIDGLVRPDVLVNATVELGMPAIAITDFSNLHGVLKFYKEAFHQGIKPIIGVDFNMSSDENSLNVLTKITLLASTNLGYKNLILLLSRAYQSGYDSKIGVVIKKTWLIEYRKDIILLSGGCFGDVGISILRENKLALYKHLSFYNKYFKNFYYFEITRIGYLNEEEYIEEIKYLSIRESIPLVATNLVCFLKESDFSIHKIRVFINQGYTINNKKVSHNYTSQQFLKNETQMSELFSDVPESLINSVEIAKRCNVVLKFGKYFLPKFPTGKHHINNYLVAKAKRGLFKRLVHLYPEKKIRNQHREKYVSRLLSELSIINKMGFPGYFLIVMEFINWSKKNAIPVGPGRGSGAGSLVSYSLNITELDPLYFDLIFERFLNSERISMPDLDIDFCMDNRDKVIEHVAQTYGRESVSQIVTFGTLTAKAVIRDVGRVLGFPYGFLNRISKLVPLDPGMTLKKALFIRPELLKLYNSDEEVKKLIDISKKLEGVTRNIGKHAGGLVIAPGKITDFSPLHCDENGSNPITQFDKEDIELMGLVKFDFLGLKTLTVIHNAVKIINHGLLKNKKNKININLISLKDQHCFNFLQTSNTIGIFQLESYGMKDLITRLKPDCFEDLIALVALFRPGPLQSGMVDNFINRKHGKEVIFYPDQKWQHALLKPILKSTYGIVLYQEQVMQIAQVLANYTLGSADILRRAMEKKDPVAMKNQRVMFKLGAKKNGIDSKLAMNIFDLLKNFVGYAFNKSHSVAYALVSYQTLWLKFYYPAEFMSAAMNADIDNTKKLVILINECKRINLNIIGPSINVSNYYFRVDDDGNIVYGLGAIKGIGKNIVSDIVNVRNLYGFFFELFDLCIRISFKKLTKRVIEKLIKSGSCDCLGLQRSMLINNYENIIRSAHQYLKSKQLKKVELFGSLSLDLKKIRNDESSINVNDTKMLELNWEKDCLGLYLTGHPVDQYLNILKKYSQCMRIKDINVSNYNKEVAVLGMIISLKLKTTRKNKKITVFSLEDHLYQLDVMVFNTILDRCQVNLENDLVVVVFGYIKINRISRKQILLANKILHVQKI